MSKDSSKSVFLNFLWLGPMAVLVASPFLFFPWAAALIVGLASAAVFNLFQLLSFGEDDTLDEPGVSAGHHIKPTLYFLLVSPIGPMLAAFALSWIGWI
jgi:hypothetical protein